MANSSDAYSESYIEHEIDPVDFPSPSSSLPSSESKPKSQKSSPPSDLLTGHSSKPMYSSLVPESHPESALNQSKWSSFKNALKTTVTKGTNKVKSLFAPSSPKPKSDAIQYPTSNELQSVVATANKEQSFEPKQSRWSPFKQNLGNIYNKASSTVLSYYASQNHQNSPAAKVSAGARFKDQPPSSIEALAPHTYNMFFQPIENGVHTKTVTPKIKSIYSYEFQNMISKNGAPHYDAVFGVNPKLSKAQLKSASVVTKQFSNKYGLKLDYKPFKYTHNIGLNILKSEGNAVYGIGSSALKTAGSVIASPFVLGFDFATHPVNTAKAIGNDIRHPISTIAAIGHSVFKENPNGDVNIFAHNLGAVIGSVGGLHILDTITPPITDATNTFIKNHITTPVLKSRLAKTGNLLTTYNDEMHLQKSGFKVDLSQKSLRPKMPNPFNNYKYSISTLEDVNNLNTPVIRFKLKSPSKLSTPLERDMAANNNIYQILTNNEYANGKLKANGYSIKVDSSNIKNAYNNLIKSQGGKQTNIIHLSESPEVNKYVKTKSPLVLKGLPQYANRYRKENNLLYVYHSMPDIKNNIPINSIYGAYSSKINSLSSLNTYENSELKFRLVSPRPIALEATHQVDFIKPLKGESLKRFVKRTLGSSHAKKEAFVGPENFFGSNEWQAGISTTFLSEDGVKFKGMTAVNPKYKGTVFAKVTKPYRSTVWKKASQILGIDTTEVPIDVYTHEFRPSTNEEMNSVWIDQLKEINAKNKILQNKGNSQLTKSHLDKSKSVLTSTSKPIIYSSNKNYKYVTPYSILTNSKLSFVSSIQGKNILSSNTKRSSLLQFSISPLKKAVSSHSVTASSTKSTKQNNFHPSSVISNKFISSNPIIFHSKKSLKNIKKGSEHYYNAPHYSVMPFSSGKPQNSKHSQKSIFKFKSSIHNPLSSSLISNKYFNRIQSHQSYHPFSRHSSYKHSYHHSVPPIISISHRPSTNRLLFNMPIFKSSHSVPKSHLKKIFFADPMSAGLLSSKKRKKVSLTSQNWLKASKSWFNYVPVQKSSSHKQRWLL